MQTIEHFGQDTTTPERKGPFRLALCLVVVLAFLVFLKSSFFVSWDLSVYMAHADNFLNGRGMKGATGLYTGSRPLFVLFLSALQGIFGKSILAIAVFEALVSAGLSVTVFLLARWLFGTGLGFLVALIFILTPGMIFWLPRHVDAVWPTAVLASFLLWIFALESGRDSRIRWGAIAAAGITIAFGIKLKETSALFVLIPLCALIFDTRARDWSIYAAFFGSTAACLLAWSIWADFGGDSSNVAGRLGQGLELRIGGWNAEGIWNLFGIAFRGFLSYFVNDSRVPAISDIFPLWWLGVIGLVAILRQAFKGNVKAFYVLMFVLAFLPFAVFAGMQVMRPSQNLIMVVMMFVGIGALLFQLHTSIMKRLGQTPAAITLLVVGLAVIAFQFHADSRNTRLFLRDGFLPQVAQGNLDFTVTARGSKLAAWIDENRKLIENNGNALAVWDTPLQHYVSWKINEPITLLNMPLKQLGDSTRWAHFSPDRVPMVSQPEERPAAFFIHSWVEPKPAVPIFVISRPGMDRFLSHHGAGLIAIRMNPAGRLIKEWIESVYRTETLASFEDAGSPIEVIRIVSPNRGADAPAVVFDRRVARYLSYVRDREPWRFPNLRTTLLRDHFALESMEEQDEFLNEGSPKAEFIRR